MRTFFSFVLLVAVVKPSVGEYFRKLQANHKLQELRNSELQQLSTLSDTNHINRVLDNILIPRVVGTKGHQQVYDYIKKELEELQWNVEVDEFEDNTPNFGRLTFKNIVARLNPNADRYLTLACHYDSKYFANDEFLGATDSAVPCAMLLNLAKTLKPYLNATQTDLSLQLIFFDGEEAFLNWGPNDSIYGAKHLATKLHENKQVFRASGEMISDLHRMDMLILLDLIGHSKPSFFSFFPDTQKWYVRMTGIEDRLRQQRLLNQPAHVYFKKAAHYGRIEDDHLPFLNKGVPILHLISTPFPKEWHTPDDNRSIVDMEATEDVQKILTAFVVEYLHIQTDQLDDKEADIPEKEL